VSGEGKADDDSQNFIYLGKISSNGFYRVEARYMHDSVGSFFISPKNGRILYAHNGSDKVAISHNGKRMAVLNDGLNYEFRLAMANMDIDNPAIELHCSTPHMIESGKITPVFKGWYDNGFDLILTVQQDSSFVTLPIRFNVKSDGWHISTPNMLDLDKSVQLSCYQKAGSSK
jgi:hypothetical protein